MNIQVQGTIEYQAFGTGTWALVTDEGISYELLEPPPALQHAGLEVNIQGRERSDVMSLAMIGPILEILDYAVAG